MLTSSRSLMLSKLFSKRCGSTSTAAGPVQKTALPRLWVPPSFQNVELTATNMRMLAYKLYLVHPENTVANFPITLSAAQRAQADSLVQLAAKPWTELTLEQKAALYRMTYPLTATDIHNFDSIRWGRAALTIAALFGVGTALFMAVHRFFSPEYPKTFSPEWKAAEAEYKKKHNIDPIF